MAEITPKKFLTLDPFAYRQFDDESKSGNRIVGCTKEQFETKINEIYINLRKEKEKLMVDGYASFCKHIFVPNFTETKASFIKITKENRSKIKSDYVARREGELPVLKRWFPRDEVNVTKAKFLDIILYSREQLNKENKAGEENILR